MVIFFLIDKFIIPKLLGNNSAPFAIFNCSLRTLWGISKVTHSSSHFSQKKETCSKDVKICNCLQCSAIISKQRVIGQLKTYSNFLLEGQNLLEIDIKYSCGSKCIKIYSKLEVNIHVLTTLSICKLAE